MEYGITNDAGETVKGGCIILNAEGKILLSQDPKDKEWSLPKGHTEAGELIEDSAVREVYEETGWRVKVIRELGEVTYVSRLSNNPVRLRLYLAEPIEQTGKPEEIPGWFGADELEGKLYPNVIEFLHTNNIV